MPRAAAQPRVHGQQAGIGWRRSMPAPACCLLTHWVPRLLRAMAWGLTRLHNKSLTNAVHPAPCCACYVRRAVGLEIDLDDSDTEGEGQVAVSEQAASNPPPPCILAPALHPPVPALGLFSCPALCYGGTRALVLPDPAPPDASSWHRRCTSWMDSRNHCGAWLALHCRGFKTSKTTMRSSTCTPTSMHVRSELSGAPFAAGGC